MIGKKPASGRALESTQECVMKHVVVLGLAAVVLASVIDPAVAQDEEWLRFPYHVTVSVEGGLGMPFKPDAFNDLWNASFPVSVAVGYVVIPYVEIKGWLTYAKWSISEIPAKDAVGIGGVTEITGGSISTTFYGASAKVYPFPKSRLMPYVELGGGYFNSSGEDLTVTREGEVVQDNSMENASGPTFLGVFGMEYGFNERWNVFAEIDYYAGFTDSFAPGDLVLGPGESRTKGGDITVATVTLGIILKI
jgi:hypothetical protein